MFRLSRFAAVVALVLVCVPAGAAGQTAPVRQAQDYLSIGYYSREGDGSGCLERGAFISANDYVVTSASTEVLARKKITAGVSQYDWCTDRFAITASGELTLDQFSLDQDLGSARVRAHGTLINSQNGDEVDAELDLTFVPTGHPRGGSLAPPRVNCTTATGFEFTCMRVLVSNGGYATGTFLVDGTDYVVAPGEPINGIERSYASVFRTNVTCALPVGVDPTQCQLIQLES